VVKQKQLISDLDLTFNVHSRKNITITLLTLLLLGLLVNRAQSQEQNKSVVSHIEFKGQKTNNLQYLHDLLHFDIGTSVDKAQLGRALQNLKNAPGIAFVTETIDTLSDRIQVLYHLEERRTLLPIVNFGGVKGNIWYRLGITDNNWRGKGHTLLAYYQNNDKRHSGELYFRNPRYLNGNWGHAFSLNKWSSVEPLFFNEGTVQYLYDNNSIAGSIIRNFGRRRFLEFGMTYFVENYKQAAEQFLENPPGPEELTEKKWLAKLIFNQNFLNYHFFYLKGYDFSAIFQKVFNTSDKSLFNSLQLQTRFFLRPSHKINLAARFKFGISTNNDSPFAPFVVDSHINIRGVGNRIDRGTAQLIFNAEVRYTMYHKQKWAAQAIAFSDLGSWRDPGGNINQLFDKNQFRQFVGLGFRVIYQKVFGATLRVDYGVDVLNPKERGLVVGLGQYF